MAKPSEKLAESLEILHVLQARGTVAIRSEDLSRTHRERLSENGFLQKVIKGCGTYPLAQKTPLETVLLGTPPFGGFVQLTLNN